MRYFPPRKPEREWRGTTGGSTRAWRQQRERILERDQWRCTAIVNGERCLVQAPVRLEIHHLHAGHGIEAADSELVTVCAKHNPRGSA